jgi:hypothetical protein
MKWLLKTAATTEETEVIFSSCHPPLGPSGITGVVDVSDKVDELRQLLFTFYVFRLFFVVVVAVVLRHFNGDGFHSP